jgi:hypothetical protein
MRTIVVATAIVAAACQQSAAQQSTLPRVERIDGDRVHTLLGPDAIPAIDQPQFVRASQATFMRDDEPVVGVVAGRVAKAYSTWFLDHHEIVNDTVAGKPVAVTW